MSTTTDDTVDPFVHGIAIKLSRAQNTITPSDILARSVIDIAKGQSRTAFITGALAVSRAPSALV